MYKIKVPIEKGKRLKIYADELSKTTHNYSLEYSIMNI